MLDRIIVGFDNSEMSRSAFAWATMLGEATGSRIVALHAIEPVGSPAVGLDPSACLEPMMPVAVPSQAWAERADRARQDASGWFEELASYCEDVDVRFEGRSVEGGLLDALCAEATPGDLVVVGMCGRFRRGGVGSTTRDLVNHCVCPVMVVEGDLRPVNRVLVAYDGTEVSRRALAFARGLGERAGWPVTVLGVARAGRSVDQVADEAGALAPGAQVFTLGEGDEAALIERFVGSDRFGLLVMGAYAESWLVDLLFGSMTGRVLARLEAPAVLVHAPVEPDGADDEDGGAGG